MKIARVVGNVVSTVKHDVFYGKSLMIIEFLNAALQPAGARTIAFDSTGCGAGDIVLVNADGAAACRIFGDETMIGDLTICGIIDTITMEGREVTPK